MSFSQTLYGVWTDLDGSSVKPGISELNNCFYPCMILDSNNQPHFIWQYGKTSDYKGEIFYKYWNEKERKWTTYGNADKDDGLTKSDNMVEGLKSAIAIDSKGFPHVVYGAAERNSFDYYLYYRYWNGEKWTSYGDADIFPEPSVITKSKIADYPPTLYLDKNDRPWIAVTLYKDYGIDFVFWDGENWRGYGSSFSEGGINTKPYFSYYGGPMVKEIYNIDGYPNILCISRMSGKTINRECLPVLVNWNGNEWQMRDYGDLDLNITQLKYDSDFRIHIVGISENYYWKPACYKYYEGDEWKILGVNETIPNTFEVDSTLTLALDENNFPHIAYSWGSLHYLFWNGELWNGREWSQLDMGIYDYLNNSYISGAEPILLLDSIGQANIGFRKSTGADSNCINFIYNDLLQKNTRLSLGVITNKYDYQCEDYFKLSVGIVNPDITRKVDIYLVLKNSKTDEYWFFPNWTSDIDFITLTLPSDLSIPLTEVLGYNIPNESPPLSHDIENDWNYQYVFYFGVFDSKNKELLDLRSTGFLIHQPENNQ